MPEARGAPDPAERAARAAAADASYGVDDHHYIFDHRGVVLDATPTSSTLNPPGLTSVVVSGVGGYVVEARIDAAMLGGALDASRTLGLDLQVNDGVGQATSAIWWVAEHGACGACGDGCCCTEPETAGDLPWCDALRFGRLVLE